MARRPAGRAAELPARSGGAGRADGEIVPLAAVQEAAIAFFEYAAPLLEVEGDAGGEALVADVGGPFPVHRAGAGAGFAADDNPVDAVQVEAGQGAEEGFQGQELDGGVGLAQQVNPANIAVGFHADAEPDLGRPGEGFVEGEEALGAFGEYLVAVPVGLGHHGENLADEVVGDGVVEEVAHGVDEDGAGLAPAEGDVQGVGVGGDDGEAVAVFGHTGGVEAFGHPLGVAVLAAGADFVAAGDGVPGGVRPFNFGGGHNYQCSSR